MAVTLSDLDVADVSGMIAAAIAVVQILIPLVLPLVLLGILRDEHGNATTASAVSWSVIGRFLHGSRWPTLLAADSASIRGVPWYIVLIARMKTILAFLTAIAAVVTPLGLYEAIVEEEEWRENVSFHYIQDPLEFGFGTPPRINFPWSRICGAWYPVECPNSFSNITSKPNGTDVYVKVENFDSHVPQYVIDAFQSGQRNMENSVSSIFDIQSRSYAWEPANDNFRPDELVPDNGQPYPVSMFRMISSNILADDYLAVEGLVIDMKNGGIGFRNHSAPPRTPYGSTWSEDLLFIEPESQCVDTNLTLDFSLPRYTSEYTLGDAVDLVLTDRGGFANLNLSYPNYTNTNTQRDPHLLDRAYKGAWVNNVMSMAYLNVTNPRNISDPDSEPFTYLNSHVGKKFPLMSDTNMGPPITIRVNALSASPIYGNYLDVSSVFGPAISDSSANTTAFGEELLYQNPFNITLDNFTTAAVVCTGKGEDDDANLDNFVASCGLVYGAPNRVGDNSSSIVFEPGSNWSIPLYSCIMAVKATIKRVTFTFNGSDDLSGLKVTEINNKVYPDEESKPLWGVERSNLKLNDVKPLWGLISGSNQGNVSLYTLRQESLYLPGYADDFGFSSSRGNYQNLPGSEFYSEAIGNVFSMYSTDSLFQEYAGQTNLAMFRRWQELSGTAEGTAKILNLIWTDVSSNAVVGTRGLHGARLQGYSSSTMSEPSSKTPAVKFMQRRVRYHWAYAIPALIVLALTAVIALATLFFTLMGRVNVTRLRQYLNKTSQGRILTTYLYGPKSETVARGPPTPQKRKRGATRRWVENMGRNPVTVAEGENDLLVIDGPRAAQARPLLEENQQKGAAMSHDHED